MFENYTEKAANVLKQAGKVSKELGQNYVGTEHILIAILRENQKAGFYPAEPGSDFPGGQRRFAGAFRLHAAGREDSEGSWPGGGKIS